MYTKNTAAARSSIWINTIANVLWSKIVQFNKMRIVTVLVRFSFFILKVNILQDLLQKNEMLDYLRFLRLFAMSCHIVVIQHKTWQKTVTICEKSIAIFSERVIIKKV